MKDININKKLQNIFIEEAAKLLDDFERNLLAYERTPQKELVEAIFRTVHTLKGTSGMFGFTNISELTHDLENIYDGIKNGQVILSHEIFEVSFKFVDHTRKLLSNEDPKDENLHKDHEALKINIADILSMTGEITLTHTHSENPDKQTKEDKKVRTWHILLRTDEKLLQRSVNLLYIFKDLAAIGKYMISDLVNPYFTIVDDEDYWLIYLVTDASLQEIEEAFMFISDNIRLIKLAESDLLQENSENSQQPENVLQDEHVLSVLEAVEQTTEQKTERSEGAEDKNKTSNTPAPRKTNISHITVSSDKLDRLMYLVSELVTTKSELLLSINNNDAVKALEAAKKIESLSKNFHDNAISIRLVPIKEMLLRFNRLIRDLSFRLGKKIEMIVQGEDTELDKNVIDIITDPLMHIIRNCIDHGIEMPEKRASKGKKDAGTIKLNAYQSGNEIYIEISDDGTGIDPEFIRSKALEKGVITPEAKLSVNELYDLIFLPGFSTAQNLTEISGRGVGMDVVRRRIQELHGDVAVISEVGVGTTFRIKLHQTIAIIETLLIQVEHRFFAVPLSEIESCTQELSTDLYQDNNRRFAYQNDLIPFVSLREAFRITTPHPVKENLLIITKNNTRFGLSADKIIGEYQAVIKPLGKLLKGQKYISGASILGDGNLAMILDTTQLLIKAENGKSLKNIQDEQVFQ
jgi:two-component system, chemotaxis family, sensor kinase CheA